MLTLSSFLLLLVVVTVHGFWYSSINNRCRETSVDKLTRVYVDTSPKTEIPSRSADFNVEFPNGEEQKGRDFVNNNAINQIYSPKNLKQGPGESLPQLLNKWNEIQGLSEKDLLEPSSHAMSSLERTPKVLGVAYRRCEYVTKLFSKTFYTGTVSLSYIHIQLINIATTSVIILICPRHPLMHTLFALYHCNRN